MVIEMAPDSADPLPVATAKAPDCEVGLPPVAALNVDSVIDPVTPFPLEPLVIATFPPLGALGLVSPVLPAVRVTSAPAPTALEPTPMVIPEATPAEEAPVVMLTAPPVPYPAPVAIVMSPETSVEETLSESEMLECVDRLIEPVDPQRADPEVRAIDPPLPAGAAVFSDDPADNVNAAPKPLPLAPTAREMPWAVPRVDDPVEILMEPPVV